VAGKHDLEVTLYEAKRNITTRFAKVRVHFYLTTSRNSQQVDMIRMSYDLPALLCGCYSW